MSDPARTAALRSADAEVSAAAQRVFDRPFVVEAGAGTGKTTLLVARCLAWAIGPGWKLAEDRLGAGEPEAVAAETLSRVAAITFTEAAAAEMATRLGEVLAEIADGKLREGIDPAALVAPEALRRQRARALLGALDRWVVRTIHAFCRRLLARHPLAAGLHPEFEVDADERITRAVAREVVEAAVREGYGEPGDPDLIALGVEGFGPAELEEGLVAFLGKGMDAGALAEAVFTPGRIAPLLEELRAALARFAAAGGGRLANTSRASSKTGEAVVALDATQDQLSRSEASVASLDALAEGARGHWSKNARERLGDWAGPKGFNASERKVLGDVAAAAAEAAVGLHAALEGILPLRPLRLERARRVLHALVARARDLLRQRGAIGYDSLLREARDLLRDQPSVRARVRSELDQLLVDEFQDTDPVQCEIVRLLALGDAPGARPGLFLVGDPKQSIYGWRAADLRAYSSLVADALGPDGEPALLRVNRRSVPAILDEVERVIAPAMEAGGADQAVFQPLVASEKREREARPPGPPRAFVEHWISWSWNPEAGRPQWPRAGDAARREAEALARDLVALEGTEGFAWRHVGVLMRTWGDLEIYLHALREAGIPYAVEGGRSFYQRREVIDASALVRCVLDPNDHLALLTWLRSPSVGVPDAALIPLWTRGFPRLVSALAGPEPAELAALGRVIDAALADLPEGVPGLARVAGWERSLAFAAEGIAHLRASFARDAVDLFVEKLRGLTLLEATEAARFPGAFRLANLDRFFRELRGELEAEDADVQGLLRRLRSAVDSERAIADARPEHAGQDAVQVMTIHGAKGLEFRHCYLVQLHKGSGGRGGTRERTVAREVEGRWEYRVFQAPTPGFAAVLAREARVEAAERVRALYVAMTRARDRLVLLGSWPLGGGKPGAKGDALIDRLLTRRESPASLEEMMIGAQAGEGDGETDGHGVRWSFPALRSEAAPPRSAEPGESSPEDLAAVESDLRELAAAREAAGRRMQRRYRAPASLDAHADEREARAEQRFGAAAAPSVDAKSEAARSVAAAAGTAVHRVLEELRLDGDLRENLARGSASLPGWIHALVSADQREATLSSARETLARIASGPLLGRFADLRDAVIARELPVLLPADPEGEGPVGFVTGAIDLLYRDPATGEFVIADYKTDRVEDPEALAERARRYTGQAAHYRRAVQEALALPQPPRFELWFLHAGTILPAGPSG
ncbi:MAG TPA: UvrD-helicase domain-containing protein [Myxococcota bacterium]